MGRVTIIAFVGLIAPRADAAPKADASTISINGKSYDTLLTMPENEPIALAVLFGGGLATDLHWTVQGKVDVAGQQIPLTITGEDTRDADTIAAALLERDIAVYQFSSIPRDDPALTTNPGMAPVIPYSDSREIACAALADATSRPRLAAVPIICIGHSLGAARALQCAASESRVTGFVLVSGAYLSNPREQPSSIEQTMVDAMRAKGADLDTSVSAEQWAGAIEAAPEKLRTVPFATIDVDTDGLVRRWEAASALHLAMLERNDHSFEREKQDLAGEPLPGGILIRLDKPTLVIYGTLDPMAYHGPMLAHAAAGAGDASWMSIDYFGGLGHNLGPVVPRTDGFADLAGPTLTGPIDGDAVDRIADFAAETATR